VTEKIRILIVDDDRMMARTVRDILRFKGHEVETAYSGPEALEKARREDYDCVLSDIKMPGVNGVELYRAIKDRQYYLPVVLMTAYAHDELVREGLEEGVITVLSKPLDLNLLLDFFTALREEHSVVIVDDDPQFCRSLGDILLVQGYAVLQITDPHGIAEKLKTDGQIVLLDMKLNSLSGLDVLREIRQWHPYLPVIVVTGYREEMAKEIDVAINSGAYACFYKPIQIEELLQTLTEIRHWELGRKLGQSVGRK
jgi:DNA-binding NtrC family response regulator